MNEFITIGVDLAKNVFQRRCRRALLRRLEQARRSAMENHVDRTPTMGTSVMINGTWY